MRIHFIGKMMKQYEIMKTPKEEDIIEVLCSLGCRTIIETTKRYPIRRCFECRKKYMREKALAFKHKRWL
jgi:hypothetical protein